MKNIITLFCIVGIFQPLFGQVHLNFSSGLNISKTKFKNLDLSTSETEPRTGYFIGLAPTFQIVLWKRKIKKLVNLNRIILYMV